MNSVNVQNSEFQEDEIDLRELWQTVKNGKKMILLFVVVIVSFTVIFTLKMPNSYKSEMILISTEKNSKLGALGGLGGLAAMAGISMGGASMTPDVAFNALLNNYSFMREFIIKNKVLEHYEDPDIDQTYIFALGYRGLYDLFKSKKVKKKDKEARIFNLIKKVTKNFSISSDKKTSLVTVSYTDLDRTYPPVIINAFLKDASKYLVDNSLENINKRLSYFEQELKKADSVEIRQSVSGTISKILEQKVAMKSKQYYECDPLTTPSIAYEKDKLKPKRGLIIVVSFIISIILGVFFVFFINFIKGNKEEENSNSIL